MAVSDSEAQLEKLRRCFAQSEGAAAYGDEKVITKLLHRMVVGLDWNGDERQNFDCAFVRPDFIAFVQERRQKGIDFGLRIHAGEVTVPQESLLVQFKSDITTTIEALHFLSKK